MVLVLKDKAYFNNGEISEMKFYVLDLNNNITGEDSWYNNRESLQSHAKRMMLEANLKLKKAHEKSPIQEASPTPPSE